VAETRYKTPRLRPSAVRKRGSELREAKQAGMCVRAFVRVLYMYVNVCYSLCACLDMLMCVCVYVYVCVFGH
jgi:hypothetical protein